MFCMCLWCTFQYHSPGGTNFGFMNGANTYSKGYGYNPTISSYGK